MTDERTFERDDGTPDRALIARHEQRVEASHKAAQAAGVELPPAKTVAAADGWLARALELRAKKGRGAKRMTAVDDRHEFESLPRPCLAAQQAPVGGLAALFPSEQDRRSTADEDDILAFLDAVPDGDDAGSASDLPTSEAPSASEAALRELLELYVDSDQEQK